MLDKRDMSNHSNSQRKVAMEEIWEGMLSQNASNLRSIHGYLNDVSNSSEAGTHFPKSITLVTDANAVFDELAYLKRGKENPSAYREVSLAGICKHHAPDWLEVELETSVIPNFSKHFKIHESETIDWVEKQVMPLIEIHRGYSDTVTVESHLDAKDLPYVTLANDLNAVGIVSNDTDIEAFGVRRLVFSDLSKLLYLARCEHASTMTKTIGHVGGYLAVQSTEDLIRGMINEFKRLPPIGKNVCIVGVTTGLALWLSKKKGREQAKHILRRAGLRARTVAAFASSGADKVKAWDRVALAVREEYSVLSKQ